MDFFREQRLRHQLRLAGNSRLNQLAEPLLRPGALESLFDGVDVKPSVLHGAARLRAGLHCCSLGLPRTAACSPACLCR